MADNPYKAIETGKPGTIGWRIHYLVHATSTQDAAASLAAEGAAEGTVVIAETQSAGRGRMGRRWHSPPGASLYATIILRPTTPVAEVARLSLVAGVAAAEALETVALGIVALKWPNDVWLRGKKTGGIIAEAITEPNQKLACVLLGIGLNLNLAENEIPGELKEIATSVLIETGRKCDRVKIAAELFSHFDSRYMELETSGFASIAPVWTHYSALKGEQVTVVNAGARETGVVAGIDKDGALLLESEGKVKRILAGDVTIVRK
jgi:BirA family transcriptional regulator, biotin operon repressor / biotin---[acetyl-CoA-carboxylase] ligase